MKVGRNLPKIRAALAAAGAPARAVCRARHHAGRAHRPLADLPDGPAPYFSLVLVPGRRGAR